MIDLFDCTIRFFFIINSLYYAIEFGFIFFNGLKKQVIIFRSI